MTTTQAGFELFLLFLILPASSLSQGLRIGNLLKMPERVIRPTVQSSQPLAAVTQPTQWLRIHADNCSNSNWFIYPNHTTIITSPGYPKHYAPFSRCTWNIQLRNPRHRMEILIQELDLESDHDWIKLTSAFDQQIITGSRIPTPFITKSHQATVTFHSDEDVEGKGFVIQISLTKHIANKNQQPDVQIRSNAKDVCGNQKTGPGKYIGIISSPGFPQNYSDNLTCSWAVTGPENSIVRVQVIKEDFATEKRHDILKLTGRQLSRHQQDPTEAKGALLATLSGQLPADSSIISPFPVLVIEFTSDESVCDRGFQLSYQIIPQITDTITLNEHSGLIQSPGYPLDYRENQRLTWIIKGAVSGSQLRLIDLQLDSSNGDHILIGRGRNVQSEVISVLKGNLPDIPSESAVISIANATEIYLHFASTFHLERRRGWIVSYEPIAEQKTTRIPEAASLLYEDRSPVFPATKHVKKESRRLVPSQGPDSHSALSGLLSTSYAVRGAASYPDFTARLMEIEVEPFHPNQNWQEDLQECLGSMFPRGILRHQRPPSFKTTIVHTTSDAVIRVVITSTDGAASDTDILTQLRSTLSMGRVRCNNSLTMYLPEMVHEATETVNGQNWLLVSVCIVAFFLVIFSIFLLIHCRKRRKVIRKLKVALTPPPGSITNFEVVMEPATQKNPLYQLRKEGTMSRPGVPRYFQNEPIKCQMDYDDFGEKEVGLRLCPQLSKSVAMGGTVISQNIPSITQVYNRHLDIILEPTDEDSRSAKSNSAASDISYEYQQREAETGEILEVCDAVTVESYASFINEWRNGRPMTVRAVKQKSLFKKQIKKDFFDEPPRNC